MNIIAIQSREYAESRMSAIINDLKLTVDDLVSVGQHSQSNNSIDYAALNETVINTNGKFKENNNLKSSISEEENKAFIKEVENERNRSLQSKNKSIGVTSLAMHINTNTNTIKPSVPQQQKTDNSLQIIWSRLQSKLNSIQSQWIDAIKEAKAVACSIDENKRNKNSKSDMLTNKVLGVQSPLISTSRSQFGDESSGSNGVFDLPRIHQLQRDLVSFSESVFKWTDGIVVNKEVVEVKKRSWELLLHLSSIGPVAPLAADSPYQSHQTGLDALVEECFNLQSLVGPKISKASSIKIHQAAERARSEQVAIIRVLESCKTCLSQWSDHAGKMIPMLSQLNKNFVKIIESSISEVNSQSDSFQLISNAIREAEDCRLNDLNIGSNTSRSSTGSHSSRSAPTLHSPWESIQRGSAGKEMVF